MSRLEPDVVLLDVEFRRQDEELLGDLTRHHPSSRVVVLVNHAEDECAFLTAARDVRLSDAARDNLDECCLASLRGSAWGCLPKPATAERVAQTVRTVASGEIAAAAWLRRLLPADEVGFCPRTRSAAGSGWPARAPSRPASWR